MRLSALSLIIGVLALAATAQLHAEQQRPNIIVMMVDDLGYSDLGCYGGEIKTPHLDALAMNGVRYVNFYNCARCHPSRATILTGLYAQQTGKGGFSGADGGANVPKDHPYYRPGYQGDMKLPVSTIPQALKTTGYTSFAIGKNHTAKDFLKFHGFDGEGETIGAGRGATGYFKPKSGKRIRTAADVLPGYYRTHAMADAAESFIRQHEGDQPYFIYWAPTAPHSPFHALEEDVAKYRDFYRGKTAADIVKARYQRQIELGIVDKAWPFDPEVNNVGGGGKVSTEVKWKYVADEAEFRSVYAAMVDSLDQGVGRVVQALKDKGQFENTLFLFLSDNGGTGPGAYSRNTPMRGKKQDAWNGGCETPAFIHWPAGTPAAQRGSINRTVAHLVDILPTVAAAGGTAQLRTDAQGRQVPESPGRSILPSLSGETVPLKNPVFIQHSGNCALVNERWKLIAQQGLVKGRRWELYNMESDPFETTNVADKHPKVVAEMGAMYMTWAERTGAYYFSMYNRGRPWSKWEKVALDANPPQVSAGPSIDATTGLQGRARVTATDADAADQKLTYTWLGTGPGTVIPSDNTAAPTLTFTDPGEYIIKVIINSPSGGRVAAVSDPITVGE